MDLIIVLLILWAVSAPLNYIVFRREQMAASGKWKRVDRLVTLTLAVTSGLWGVCVILIVALLNKVNATAWANREARW